MSQQQNALINIYVDTLLNEIAELHKNKLLQKAQYDFLTNEYEALKAEYSKLQEENTKLVDQNKKPKKIIKQDQSE